MKLYLEDGRFIDTSKPLDISIPLQSGSKNLRAWDIDSPRFEPVETHQIKTEVAKGASVNSRNIYFNPHGHGTHTECLGHITKEVYSINQILKTFFFKARLISLKPEQQMNPNDGKLDSIIRKKQMLDALKDTQNVEALIIRTLPNEFTQKCHHNYSNTNPPYFEAEIVDLLNQLNIQHLLVDVPSVDREIDGGKLTFHKRYWNVSEAPNFKRTITEFIFVDNAVNDGEYLLELQCAPFENDASPSRPLLYRLNQEETTT